MHGKAALANAESTLVTDIPNPTLGKLLPAVHARREIATHRNLLLGGDFSAADFFDLAFWQLPLALWWSTEFSISQKSASDQIRRRQDGSRPPATATTFNSEEGVEIPGLN